MRRLLFPLIAITGTCTTTGAQCPPEHLNVAQEVFLGCAHCGVFCNSAEEGVAADPNGDAFYTSRGSSPKNEVLIKFDSDWGFSACAKVDYDDGIHHMGDIAVVGDYIYAPLSDFIPGGFNTTLLHVAWFDKGTLEYVGHTDLSEFLFDIDEGDIAGVAHKDGELFVVEYQKDDPDAPVPTIYRFDLLPDGSLNLSPGGYSIFSIETRFANGIEIVGEFALVSYGSGDGDDAGSIDVYRVNDIGAGPIFTWTFDVATSHAQGLTFANGKLWVAQGDDVYRLNTNDAPAFPGGLIEDCFGNCAPADWVGDGICNDGSYTWNGEPIYFNCDEFDCDGGDCVCGGDSCEPNETCATACDLGTLTKPFVLPDLNINPSGDEDFFEFTTVATGGPDDFVRIEFTHALGDLNLCLWNADCGLIGCYTSQTDNEQFPLDGLPAGTYHVDVYSPLGHTNDYTLVIDPPADDGGGDACEPNETCATACALGTLTEPFVLSDLNINPSGDEDFFEFTMVATGGPDDFVRIEFTHALGDLNLCLWTADCGLIGCYTSQTDNEQFPLEGLPAGTYHVDVYSPLGHTNDYTLIIDPPPGDGVVVPGTSNPWLAGMPDGSTACNGDSAPDQSPVLVTGLNIQPFARLSFSATGSVSNGPCCPAYGPDGNPNEVHPHGCGGDENGIADVCAPNNSLLGVFLTDELPTDSPPPDGLDFCSPESLDFLTLSPQVKQVFFIGDGMTSGGDVQEIVVPSDATRLYLGTMDGSEWNNNSGEFIVSVTVSLVVVPGTSNPWLAGMPDGSTACNGDSAPDQSPVLVTGLNIQPFARLSFSATGSVSNGPCCPAYGPDGNPNEVFPHGCGGDENGIAVVCAPTNSLLGVFLTDELPTDSPPPDGLDFCSPESLDFLTLSPQVKQVFFIGDGMTSGGDVQEIVVPSDATRFYLGTMDGSGWNNNSGFFEVGINVSGPVPGDLDGDGSVGAIDLLILLVNWGPCGDCNDCLADLDDDCNVGASDLLILLVNWG